MFDLKCYRRGGAATVYVTNNAKMFIKLLQSRVYLKILTWF